jgi:hypothetical protein
MDIVLIGRDGEIRTRDPLHPMQVRYQAAPRPDRTRMLNRGAARCNRDSRPNEQLIDSADGLDPRLIGLRATHTEVAASLL